MSTLLLFYLIASAVASPLDFLNLDWRPQALLTQTAPPTDRGNLVAATPYPKEQVGWYDPRTNGGRLLDYTSRKYGEPLNVIISGLSDPYVLTDAGFRNYAKSLGYSGECLGMHYGQLHDANLGDGDGRKTEQYLARQFYFPVWGTCWESLAGGHHFRAWKQNGTMANSGAWFIGASKEYDSSKNHKIVPDGYNIGRDWFVDRAIEGRRWNGMWWKADVEWRDDLIDEGKKGVNHGIAQDGRIAVLTVNRI
ncbi:hypothetical protein D9619_013176 [Psilocybe cf. subviscida]|uniref:Uncharacterized protein n=1 Tax=Psilocybe cf. subviscida TaxID=2480587 RepID=A0A8H5B7J1_9AGAR|nr:hypothetical protein D9619_013176 [Psilocybe cf. subviscida]